MGGTTASRVTAGESGITGTTLGATGGSQSHALSIAQLAAHNHSQTAHSHSIIARYYNAGSPWNDNYAAGSPYVHRGPANIPSLVDEWIGGLDSPAPAIQNNGSGSTHQNTQPSIICNYILKL
jgi:microcystin-dependent protein